MAELHGLLSDINRGDPNHLKSPGMILQQQRDGEWRYWGMMMNY